MRPSRRFNEINIVGCNATIYLRRNFETIVDADVVNEIGKSFWFLDLSKPQQYVTKLVSGKRILLHRIITGCPKGMVVDHINHDTLDNRRANLRICTQAQNSANRRVACSNKLGLKGVYAYGKKFKATISVRGQTRIIGYYDTPENAHAAYLSMAKETFGEFACG